MESMKPWSEMPRVSIPSAFPFSNGYVIELTTVKEDASGERPDAHQILADWQAAKQA